MVYGESNAGDSIDLQSHVRECATCQRAVESIEKVRTTMRRLSFEPAPETGFESLVAYAQKSASQQLVPTPSDTKRRWWIPVASLVGLASAVAIVVALTLENRPDVPVQMAQVSSPAAVDDAPAPPTPVPLEKEIEPEARGEMKPAKAGRRPPTSKHARKAAAVADDAVAPEAAIALAPSAASERSAMGAAAAPMSQSPLRERSDDVDVVALAHQTIDSRVLGEPRIRALKVLCDHYEKAGDLPRAQLYCDRLVREFPESPRAAAP